MGSFTVSRRAFLAGTGATVLLAACSGGSDGESDGDDDGALQALRVSSELYPTDTAQRFAFALASGTDFVSGPPATIAFTTPDGGSVAPQTAKLRGDGLPAGRGIYVTETVLDQEGIWQGLVDVEGKESELPFEVLPVASPVPGATAPISPSPTRDDPLGVDPICTRDPQCPLHDVSLTELVGNGQSLAVMFATPARCQTQYCGPVLDLLLDVRDEGVHPDVNAVHVEIYRSLTGAALVPTVDDWRLESEPWLFGIDGAGTVIERLDGAFDRGEIRGLLDRLSA
ncbi:MAG: hypothetical protein ACRDWD_14435 [Acidimicrobiia bacterium]